MENIQDSHYGKTCREHSAATKERTSVSSSKKLPKSPKRMPLCLRFRKVAGPTPTVSAETDGAWRTEFLMRNTGESPKDAVASTLSQILLVNAPKKYYLSAKACEGILRRAQKRGKELPPMLKAALEQKVAKENATE